MEIKRFYKQHTTIEAFADEHGLKMEVRERDSINNLPKYFASFEDAEVKDGIMLTSTYGDGNTERMAILDYAENISGRLLVIHAYSDQRREIRVPILDKDSCK